MYCGSCGSKINESVKKPSVPFDSSSIVKGLKGLASRAREQTKTIRSEIEDRVQSQNFLKTKSSLPSSQKKIKTSKKSFINSIEVKNFSKVLARVMKNHVEALKAVTGGRSIHDLSQLS